MQRSRPTNMAAGRGNVQDDAPGGDLYAVLGLNKECTDAELRVAYRKLAMVRVQCPLCDRSCSINSMLLRSLLCSWLFTDDPAPAPPASREQVWHPDRCSASGSSARVEEAKERFQEIQGAYAGEHPLISFLPP